jgi:integrase/recombinase XerD
MERALARYLRHHRAEGRTDKALAWHRDSVGHFMGFLKGRGASTTLEDLALDAALDWIEWQQGRGLSQKTIPTRVVSLKASAKWLADEEWLPKDPLAMLKRPKVDDKPKDPLTPAEIDRLLGTCDRKRLTGARDLAIMLLLFSTRLRDSEVRGLHISDLDWDGGLIMVRRGKGGKFRVVPLGHAVAVRGSAIIAAAARAR